MSKMIQLRNVPDALHRRLRTRAALAGMTLSDYLQRELEQIAGTLTYDELRKELSGLRPAKVAEPAAAVIRRERDAR
jgi:plasmid stability protein